MAELFIDGRWVSARAGAKREIRCPADNSLVAEIDEAGPEDTEAAIAAFEAVPPLPGRHRRRLCATLARRHDADLVRLDEHQALAIAGGGR